MSKRLVAAALAAIALPLGVGGCAQDYAAYGYGGGYGYGGYGYGRPYAYEGYYDGFYGPIYDGYWGNNGYFYYRGGAGDRRFYRADRSHFSRGPGGPGFQPHRGQFTPGPGMRTPHFSGRPGGGFGGGRPGGGHHR